MTTLNFFIYKLRLSCNVRFVPVAASSRERRWKRDLTVCMYKMTDRQPPCVMAVDMTIWEVKVTLRLAAYRQSVRLGVKPLKTHDQTLFFNWTFAVIVLMYNILSDQKVGLSLLNMLGLSSSVHFTHIACYWKLFLFHYIQVLSQYRLYRTDHAYVTYLMLQRQLSHLSVGIATNDPLCSRGKDSKENIILNSSSIVALRSYRRHRVKNIWDEVERGDSKKREEETKFEYGKYLRRRFPDARSVTRDTAVTICTLFLFGREVCWLQGAAWLWFQFCLSR
jgi:hypothetical protein